MQSPMINRIKKEAKKVEDQKFFVSYLCAVGLIFVALAILTFIK